MSLVTPGEGREDTRASAVYPEQDDAMAAVINKFSAADSRLLVTGEDVPSTRRLVEISHEALIREWNLLQERIETNREALRRRDHIRARMHQWEEQGKDPTLLLPSGLPLEEGRKLLADHGDVLIDEVQPYIAASTVAAKAKEDEARAVQRRRVREARLTAVVMAVLAIVAIAGGSVAWWQRGVANRNAETAQRNQWRALTALANFEVKTGSPAKALRVALAAVPQNTAMPDRAYDRQAEGAIWNALQNLRERRRIGHEDSVDSVAFSPDGRTLAIGSSDNTARLWEVVTGTEIVFGRGRKSVVSAWLGNFCVAFSPDGRTLATGSSHGTARLWEVATGTEIVDLSPKASISSVAFSPDGRTLATGSSDETARLWDVGQGLIDYACARVHDLPLPKRTSGVSA